MIIECKKRAEGYKPVKGNEEEIINHLLDHYGECYVEKNKETVSFHIPNKELTSSLMYNHKQEYIIKNLMYESMMNIIRIYENLIEKIKNGEFDKTKKNSLSTYTLPPNYGFHCAEKSIKPLNKIISLITEKEYNEDFIDEMKRIEQEKSEKL